MSKECNTECFETERCDKPCEAECPIEGATQLWEGAFCQAMRDVFAAQLRTRIEKQWGELIGKEADAMMAHMSAHWGVSIAKVQAHTAREAFKKTMVDNWLAAASGKK